MFALALKDFSLLGKRLWLLACWSLCILFYYTNGLIGLVFSIMPSLYLVSWACGMDFRYKADSFVSCLPAPRRSVVAARFLGIPLSMALGFAGGLAIWALRSAFGEFIPAARLPGIASLSLALALASNSVYLAAYYVFGYQHARWAIFIFYACIGALGPIMNSLYPGSAATGIPAVNALVGGQASPGFYAAALAAGVAVSAVCYALSLAAYRRREF